MDINQDPQIFLFLSKILGKKLLAPREKHWAEFIDPYPVVTGIIFSSAQKKPRFSFLERCDRF